jgi:hypothetical protein
MYYIVTTDIEIRSLLSTSGVDEVVAYVMSQIRGVNTTGLLSLKFSYDATCKRLARTISKLCEHLAFITVRIEP